jgi:hypothetical protein
VSDFRVSQWAKTRKSPTAQGVAVAKKQSQTIALTENSDFRCVTVGENEKNPTALGVAVAKQQSQTIALTQNSNLETKHNKHKLLASLL